MKTEMEIAMKLLEKDTHEKQDTLVALRQQLEEVKAINLQMFHKVQVGVGFMSVPQPVFCCLSQAASRSVPVLPIGERGHICEALACGRPSP